MNDPVLAPPFTRLVLARGAIGEHEAGLRLDIWVVGRLRVERTAARALREGGRVRVDGRAVVHSSPRLAAGAGVVVLSDDARPEVLPESIPLEVLHEDRALFVIDKPPLMAVTPGTKHPAGTLANALRGSGFSLSSEEGELRPGIVHRLDRGTSGAMVIAKDDVTHRRLAALFAKHDVRRAYVALVHGSPTWDELWVDAPIAPPRAGRKSRLVRTGGRPARTRLVVKERLGVASVVAAEPETGRTHQIRVHLAWSGHPILGDTLYAGTADRGVWSALGVRRPCLHAARIAIDGVDVEAPLPEDLAFAIDRAKRNAGMRSSPTT